MEDFLAWLSSLPPALLYLMLAVTAAVENFIPPLPADTVVAFGSFLAAKGHAPVTPVFLSIWLGNISGAAIVYAIARRYGAAEMRDRLKRYGREGSEQRLEKWHAKYGLLALFISRFLPGVRALVPPFAGAMRMKFLPAFAAIGSASAIWYGLVTIVAYRVGSNWETLRSRVGTLTTRAGLIAAVIAVVGIGWYAARRWRRSRLRGTS
jgi:membrane protein DedA with SNARE-associated domain